MDGPSAGRLALTDREDRRRAARAPESSTRGSASHVYRARLTNDLREATVFYTVFVSPIREDSAKALRARPGIIRSRGRTPDLPPSPRALIHRERAAGERASDRTTCVLPPAEGR